MDLDMNKRIYNEEQKWNFGPMCDHSGVFYMEMDEKIIVIQYEVTVVGINRGKIKRKNMVSIY